jgi:glutathione S-transferase
MRRLYHYATSPFSRRVRLALSYKGLEHELIDVRASPENAAALRGVTPLHTVPVLVEDDGGAIPDSMAIVSYIDRAYCPDLPLWPVQREDARLVAQVIALVDGALNTIVNLGMRYYGLRTHSAWDDVQREQLARAQGALDSLAAIATRLDRPTIARTGWSVADMALFTSISWLEGLPARAPTNQNVAHVLSLGWNLPQDLSRWADAHRARPEIVSL